MKKPEGAKEKDLGCIVSHGPQMPLGLSFPLYIMTGLHKVICALSQLNIPGSWKSTRVKLHASSELR